MGKSIFSKSFCFRRNRKRSEKTAEILENATSSREGRFAWVEKTAGETRSHNERYSRSAAFSHCRSPPHERVISRRVSLTRFIAIHCQYSVSGTSSYAFLKAYATHVRATTNNRAYEICTNSSRVGSTTFFVPPSRGVAKRLLKINRVRVAIVLIPRRTVVKTASSKNRHRLFSVRFRSFHFKPASSRHAFLVTAHVVIICDDPTESVFGFSFKKKFCKK